MGQRSPMANKTRCRRPAPKFPGEWNTIASSLIGWPNGHRIGVRVVYEWMRCSTEEIKWIVRYFFFSETGCGSFGRFFVVFVPSLSVCAARCRWNQLRIIFTRWSEKELISQGIKKRFQALNHRDLGCLAHRSSADQMLNNSYSDVETGGNTFFWFFFSASASELKNAHKLVKYGRTLRNETSVSV